MRRVSIDVEEEPLASSEVARNAGKAKPGEMPSREDELLAARRIYNRTYMRRWRAKPSHAAREQLNRRRSYHDRKLRTARIPRDRYQNCHGELFCAFCRRRPSVMQVTRLTSSAVDASRYVEIRMPYCGEC